MQVQLYLTDGTHLLQTWLNSQASSCRLRFTATLNKSTGCLFPCWRRGQCSGNSDTGVIISQIAPIDNATYVSHGQEIAELLGIDSLICFFFVLRASQQTQLQTTVTAAHIAY
jgi:hypothetical protein